MPQQINVSLRTRRKLDMIKREVFGDEPTEMSDETLLALMTEEVLEEETILDGSEHSAAQQ